jgi:hypothetical protein
MRARNGPPNGDTNEFALKLIDEGFFGKAKQVICSLGMADVNQKSMEVLRDMFPKATLSMTPASGVRAQAVTLSGSAEQSVELSKQPGAERGGEDCEEGLEGYSNVIGADEAEDPEGTQPGQQYAVSHTAESSCSREAQQQDDASRSDNGQEQQTADDQVQSPPSASMGWSEASRAGT